MTISPNAILRITATWTMPGTSLAQNVFYAKYVAGGAADEEDVVDDMLLWVETMFATMEDHMQAAVTLDGLDVSQWVSGTPGSWVDIGEVAGTFVGLAIGEALPLGVALVVRASTDIVKALSRKYLPGLVESAVNENVWETNVLTDAVLFIVEWLVGPTGDGRTYNGGTWSTVTQAFGKFIGEGVLSTIPGYQRRRKPGVGM